MIYKTNRAKKGTVISLWSPIHWGGAVSTNAALLSSYIACKVINKTFEKVLVLSNEMSHNFQVSDYLTMESVPDGLSDIYNIVSSGAEISPNILANYAFALDDGIDILGPICRNENSLRNLDSIIVQILNYCREAYDYIIVDTSSGLMNQTTLAVHEASDVILVCMPQDKKTLNNFRDKQKNTYSEAFDRKPYLIVGSCFYDYSHFGLGKMSKEVGDKVYPLSLNDLVNRAVQQRDIYSIIQKECMKKKAGDDVLDELDDIVNAFYTVREELLLVGEVSTE